MPHTVDVAREGNMVGGEALPTILEAPLHAPPPDSTNYAQSRGLAMSAPIHMYVQTPIVLLAPLEGVQGGSKHPDGCVFHFPPKPSVHNPTQRPKVLNTKLHTPQNYQFLQYEHSWMLFDSSPCL